VKDFTKIPHNEGQMCKQSDSIGRRWAAAVERADLGRSPQKNASKAFEVNFQYPAGQELKYSAAKAYRKDCREWLEKKFPGTLLQWNTHFHETKPHAHGILIPIIRGPDGNRYSSSGFLGGPDGLEKLQTEIFEYLSGLKNEFGNPKYPGIERGEPSEERHTGYKEWGDELAREQKKLDEREKIHEAKVAEYDAAVLMFNKKIEEYNLKNKTNKITPAIPIQNSSHKKQSAGRQGPHR
jgi:hypothetical protein